ncbi:hypothetical protein SAMN05421773_10542 [Streptomyces aidingensis]|uniref:Uncharacterized protein n=1 Tax=Streptomyces aidingensis TaxID=910347 RepID=A0A1I1L5H8_9ACTN|nr:hypothetical protein SAMN05421773_10542 [Streptomyces aidingensis]
MLLFIASFLTLREVDAGDFGGQDWNGWSSDWFPVLPSVFLAGIIGAALIVMSRFVPPPVQAKEYLGLRLDQWGVALSVTSFWAAFWTLIGAPDGVDNGAGMILGFIAALLLAAAAAATPMIPALKQPLLTAGSSSPQPQAPYGQQPPAQPQPGYGYPGPGTGAPDPNASAPTQFAGQPAHQQFGQQPPAQPQPAAAASADPNFQPFWFAVPAARPLYGEDGSPSPIAELTPGTWYLAVEQRGQTLVAQTQDGRRGVLQDTSNIQRG